MEPDLRAHFNPYGVVDVSMNKSYALVIFEAINNAEEALELDKTYLNGHQLCLSFYERNQRRRLDE